MPLLYAPDKDHRIPGLIVDCLAHPTEAGYAAIKTRTNYPSSIATYFPFSGGGKGQTIFGAIMPGGGGRLYSGYTGVGAGASKLYEYTITAGPTGVTTDVSIAAAYTCTFPPTVTDGYLNTWQFANWGSVVFATNLSETARTVMQYQTASGAAFADLATSPRAGCIEVFKDFILAGNINTTFGGGIVGTGDMIAWSDQAAYTVWTPASGVQANWARLRDSPGDIVAMKRLGDAVIVYKSDAIYRMTFIGPPYTFKFEKIVDGIGCAVGAWVSPCVVDVGGAHVFIGKNDIYLFDGNSRPVPIGTGNVLQTWRAGGAVGVDYMIHDIDSSEVFFLTKGFVYNYKLNKWGKDILTVRTASANAIAGASISSMVRSVNLYGGDQTGQVPACRLWSGSPASSESPICYHSDTDTVSMSLTSGLIGTHDKRTLLKRAHPIMGKGAGNGGGDAGIADASTTYTLRYESIDAANWSVAVPANLSTFDARRRRFDMLSEGYYHRMKLDVTFEAGTVIEVRDLVPTVVPTGGKD